MRGFSHSLKRKWQPRHRQWQATVLLVLVMFVLGACGGLSGEPEIVGTIAPPTLVLDSESGITTANIANGEQIFLEHCTQCHGINGDGQGEFVLNGQVPPMRSFLERETASDQTPEEWFEIITNGRLEALMPPWENALSEQERWDVALYTYTLWHSPELVEQGNNLFQELDCTDCHINNEMMNNSGDPHSGNLQDPAGAATLSDQNYATIISEGAGDMPAYDELDDNNIWALVAYTRSLSYESTARSTESEDLATAASGIFYGTVTNDTLDALTPDNTFVSLRYGNSIDGIEQVDTVTDDQGAYTFENIPIRTDYEYAVVAFYNGQIFLSDVVAGEPDTPDHELPVTVYELTEDPTVVTISDLEIALDPIFNDPELGDGLIITENFIYTNSSDRAFSTNQPAGNNRFATLLVVSPENTTILNDPENPRYLVAQAQNALIDTTMVLPGESHRIQATYFVPLEDSESFEFVQPFNNNLNGNIQIVFPRDFVSFSSDQFEEAEVITQNEITFAIYESDISMDRGEPLQFTVSSGRLPQSLNTSNNPDIITTDKLILPFGILIGLLLVGFIGVWFFFFRKRQRVDHEINLLLQEIAELDHDHETGKINHDVYRQKHRELNARLDELRDNTKPVES